MAIKNMIKVGDTVTFGRGAERRMGKVTKLNPKTARIRVAGDGQFDVTYNLISKRNPSPSGESWAGGVSIVGGAKKPAARKPAARKPAARKPAARKPAAKPVAKWPKQKAIGRKICATPVATRQCKQKLNPARPPGVPKKGLRGITPAWAQKQPTAALDRLGQVLVDQTLDWATSGLHDMEDDELIWEINKRLNIILDVLETRSDWRNNKTKWNPPRPYHYGMESKRLKKASSRGDWGDPAAFATTHPDAYAEMTTGEYVPGRTRPNPANLTAKGERMYGAIKAGYGRDPRAKEIAARTVYARSHEVPGLIRKKRKR